MAATRTGEDVSRLHADVERLGRHGRRSLEAWREQAPDLARQATGRVRERLDQQLERWGDRGREAAGAAGEEVENARVYVVERVQERPLTITAAALGVGVLLGVLLAGSRR